MDKLNESSIFNDIIGADFSESQVEEQQVEETKPDESTESTDSTEEVEGKDAEATNPDEETDESVNEEVESTEESTKEETKEEEKTETVDPKLAEIAKSLDPEAEVVDTKSALERVAERIAEQTEELDTLRRVNKEVFDVLNDIPEMGDFMNAVIKGMDPQVAAAIYISETLAPEEGEKTSKEYKAKLAEKIEAQKKNQEAIEEYRKNAKQSPKTVESFVKSNNLKSEEFTPLLQEFDGLLSEVQKGILPEKLLSIVYKASKYDKDIKDAEEKGFLRGQNQKIKLIKDKDKTDGMPGLTSSISKTKDVVKERPKDVVDKLLGL